MTDSTLNEIESPAPPIEENDDKEMLKMTLPNIAVLWACKERENDNGTPWDPAFDPRRKADDLIEKLLPEWTIFDFLFSDIDDFLTCLSSLPNCNRLLIYIDDIGHLHDGGNGPEPYVQDRIYKKQEPHNSIANRVVGKYQIDVTMVLLGPRSGIAKTDIGHLYDGCNQGKPGLLICSMDDTENFKSDSFDLAASLPTNDDFNFAGRQERARLDGIQTVKIVECGQEI